MTKICTRLLALLVFLPMLGFGQVGFQIAPDFFPQFTDVNGNPLAGGFVQAYSAGSSTPLATYCDNIGTANLNPIPLNSAGRPQSNSGALCGIYLSQNSYKFCVQDSNHVQVGCQDNVQNISQVLLTTANTWTLGQTFNSLINFLGGTSDTTAADGNEFYRTDLHRLRWYDSGAAAWHSIIGADSTDTLTNKTLTAPVVTNPSITGTDSGAETLTNKTLTTPAIITSTLATGAAPLVISSTTPVANLTTIPITYAPGGTQIVGAHIVRVDSTTLAGGAATVTLVGAAVFTAASTYQCSFSDMTAANAVKYLETDGSHIALTGTGTDVITGICIGN